MKQRNSEKWWISDPSPVRNKITMSTNFYPTPLPHGVYRLGTTLKHTKVQNPCTISSSIFQARHNALTSTLSLWTNRFSLHISQPIWNHISSDTFCSSPYSLQWSIVDLYISIVKSLTESFKSVIYTHPSTLNWLINYLLDRLRYSSIINVHRYEICTVSTLKKLQVYRVSK